MRPYNFDVGSDNCVISRVEKGEKVLIEDDTWTRDLLDTYKCYILDCGSEVFVWMGRNTSLDQRKTASSDVDVSPAARIKVFSPTHFY